MGSVPENLLTEWARLLIGSLVAAGVEYAVLSPGSRNTPLIAAALEHRALRSRVVVDERSAAFVALGQAKLSGRPSLLVCTSGSAAAHYLPALIEADESHTPLIVLSADRPCELQFNRSPQTIDQTRLFGDKVRAYLDLGGARAELGALQALQRKAAQAVLLATSGNPGPVHLNFPAAKPLEPTRAKSPVEEELRAQVEALLTSGGSRAFPALGAPPAAAAIDALCALAQSAERPLFTLGPCAPTAAESVRAVARLALECGWPVIAEGTSQFEEPAALHFHGFDLVYQSTHASDYAPDLVLQFGDPPTSSAWAALLARSPHTPRVVVSEFDWPDPHNHARLLVRGALAQVADVLRGRLPAAKQAWRERVAVGSALARSALSAWLEGERRGARAPRGAADAVAEGPLVGAVLATLEPGDLLIVGNSLPVRHIDLPFGVNTRATATGQLGASATAGDAPSASLPAGLKVLSQRGVNGIDGLVSLALGAALVHAEQRPSPAPSATRPRSVLLLGDVSALHDAGGLLAISEAQPELSVVVINNGGGRIFEQLPIAQREDLAAWITPHRVRLYELAHAYGVTAARCETEEELRLALSLARERVEPIWIEVMADPSGSQRMYRELLARLDVELATGPLG